MYFLKIIYIFSLFINTETFILKKSITYSYLQYSKPQKFNKKTINCNNKQIENEISELLPPFNKNNVSAPTIEEKSNKKIELPGISIGIPMTILSYIYTHNHYHENILDIKMIIMFFLIGLYTYGNDRINDALQYEQLNDRSIIYNEQKIKLYENILENKNTLKNIYDASYIIFTCLMFENNGITKESYLFIILYNLSKFIFSLKYTFFSYYLGMNFYNKKIFYIFLYMFLYQTKIFENEFLYLPFLLTIDSTNYYIDIKKKIGFLKPYFVSSLWIMCIMILPSVIHDHNYDILKYPNDYMSPLLLLSSLSNLADIIDITQDKENGINTIPVVFGKTNAYSFSLINLIISYLLILDI